MVIAQTHEVSIDTVAKPQIVGATILVVDDLADNRLLLTRRLEKQGHTVVTVDDGLAALAVLRTQPFDMVLLDMMMPHMNGYEALTHIKADAELRYLPVVMISAADDMESIARCIAAGAEDYLHKPFDHVLLHARVQSSLAKKRLHDQERAIYAAIEAANLAKSEFIAQVAHELKTPLTAIRGHADLLLKGYLGTVSEDQAESLQAIHRSTDLMTALVADLADVSRIESGHLKIVSTPVMLADVITNVAATFQEQLAAKAQTLTLHMLPNLPPVQADRTRLVQILNNLLSNASKYTPDHGQITIEANLAEAGMTHIVVRDSGIGMSHADQQRIFQKFFRSSDEQTRRVSGTGLGLHITRHLVELQDGRIWFESTLGGGSSFHFTVPVAETQLYAS